MRTKSLSQRILDTVQQGGTREQAVCLWNNEQAAKRAARNKASRERNQAMRDMGLVKVRGNLGGVYWE